MLDSYCVAFLIHVIVEVVFNTPHHAVDSGLQCKIYPLVLEGKLLVVEDIAYCRHIVGEDSHGCVEVYGVFCVSPKEITCVVGLLRHHIETILHLEVFLDPSIVFLKIWNHILQSLLVADLVIEHELNKRKKREGDTKRVLRIDHRRVRIQIISIPDMAVAFLAGIEIVNHGVWGIHLVGIHQEQRRQGNII